MHFGQNDLTNNFIGHRDDLAFFVLLLERFINLDLVTLRKTIGGTQGNPDLFAFHELDHAFDIALSGRGCGGSAGCAQGS